MHVMAAPQCCTLCNSTALRRSLDCFSASEGTFVSRGCTQLVDNSGKTPSCTWHTWALAMRSRRCSAADFWPQCSSLQVLGRLAAVGSLKSILRYVFATHLECLQCRYRTPAEVRCKYSKWLTNRSLELQQWQDPCGHCSSSSPACSFCICGSCQAAEAEGPSRSGFVIVFFLVTMHLLPGENHVS